MTSMWKSQIFKAKTKYMYTSPIKTLNKNQYPWMPWIFILENAGHSNITREFIQYKSIQITENPKKTTFMELFFTEKVIYC